MAINKLLDVGTISRRAIAASMLAMGAGLTSFAFGLHEIANANDLGVIARNVDDGPNKDALEEMVKDHHQLGEKAMKGAFVPIGVGVSILLYAPDHSRREEQDTSPADPSGAIV